MKGCLENISREYGVQRKLPKGEIEHSVTNNSNFADLRHISEPYFRLDVLCLAFIYARRSTEMQKLSGFGSKDCLTEATLGWKCFGTYKKVRENYTFNDVFLEILYVNRSKVGELLLLKDTLNQISKKKT